MRQLGRILLAVVACVAGSSQAGVSEIGPSHQEVISSSGFLSAHPDIRWRAEGVRAYEAGKHVLAGSHFQRAAHFADKPSQAMFAEMLWAGMGVPRDPVAAYIWMDLAAERHYRPFLIKREQYWQALTPEQRKRAVDEGQQIYAEYGDDVAKPRLELKLRRGARGATGSRLGSASALRVLVPGPGGQWVEIPGSHYYAPQYWEPERYWEWQDRIWKAPPKGQVDIGPLKQVPAPKAGSEPSS